MKVQCTRCNTIWIAKPRGYPSEARQTTFYATTGDLFIDCPACGRRYFWHDAAGDEQATWRCDRDLIIIE